MIHSPRSVPSAGVSTGSKSTARLLWALFSLFVVYGTTIPFSFHAGLGPGIARINLHPLGMRAGDISTPDLLQNILLFIPFGFLGYISLHDKKSSLKLLALVAMGAGLSAFVEFLQLFSATRWPALSDVLFNTLGTAVGVASGMWLKGRVLGIKSNPAWRRVLDAPSAFPALVFLGLAVAGSWEPFDFALDVGLFVAKARQILGDPFDLTWPNDELVVFIRFLLATLFACRLADETGLHRPARILVPALSLLALGLEGTQIIITSRSPAFQDAVTTVLGVAAGGVAFGFPGFREHPWKWGAVGTQAVFASAVMDGLHPFNLHDAHSGFNWLPFMAEYANTGFQALSNVVEAALIYFPLGFLLGYFFPASRLSALMALALVVVLSFAVETAQGFVVGRHADVTDVIGAAMGCLAGSLALRRGWRAYRAYVAE